MSMGDTFVYWRHADSKIWESYENCRPFKEMGREGARVAEEQQLSKELFDEQLYQLFDAYSSFLHGTNSGSDSDKWKHWYNHFRDVRLTKKHAQPQLSQEMLSSAAYTYLNGALRVPKMDRALIDALIAQETFAFIDRHAGLGAHATNLGCFGFFLLASVAWQLFTGDMDWTRFLTVLAVVAGLMALMFLWPRRGTLKLYMAMRETYHLLSGSVVSVPEVRRAVERAREQGVVWPPELYAVLDDVEARTQRL